MDVNMDLLKTVLLLSFIVLALVVIMAHKEYTKPEKPVKVKYEFFNYNF
tara:strand:- start:423 stop:569 length:147 start_codon:yes stop_codon:yes gene_type:complete